ncbi:hypothetical protein WJX84_002435 [Apatococcus fuscideae]|uniref:Protein DETOXIFICATION n=1 Tax=Apatococcus fuscideae TaxID=2026836 RepID=A0AAW1S781_9CHLO
MELLQTLATLASDPLASLVDTAFLGHYGSIQLAASGVALSVHGVFTKLLNMPLLSVTTSTVATAMGEKGGVDGEAASVAASASLLLGLTAGIIQAGRRADGGRAIGCPTTLLLLVSQGVFRGLGDTRTPLYATLACNLLNIILNPLLIFGCKMGVVGSALGTLIAQTIGAAVLVVALQRKVRLKLAGDAALDSLKKFVAPTGWLTLRTMSISGAFAFATSVAARTDSIHTATHQVCLQIWLAASLLADALAVAAQSLIARYLSSNNQQAAQDVTKRSFGFPGFDSYSHQGFRETHSQGFTDQSFFEPAPLLEQPGQSYAENLELPLEHLEDCPLARIERYIANWMAEESLSQATSDHPSQSSSSLIAQASSSQAVRNARVYQIMLVAHELVLEGRKATQRDIWYRLQHTTMFGSRDCSALSSFSFQTTACCIVIVEKDAIFQRLAEDHFFDMVPSILLTAKGMPDMATRAAAHAICSAFPHLPVVSIVDWNPSGATIAGVYKWGCNHNHLHGARFALPHLQWFGLRSSMLEYAPEDSFLPMSSRDLALVRNLRLGQMQHEPSWLDELDMMESSGVKAEIEALYSVTGLQGFSVMLADCLLSFLAYDAL